MTIKSRILAGLCFVLFLAVAAVLYFKHLEKKSQETKYFTLIQEGFELLAEPTESDCDKAEKKAFEARKIRPKGRETYLLLGRAYYEKKQYKKTEDVLKKGLAIIDDLETRHEFHYYLGMTYLKLYSDLNQLDIWKKALESFNEAKSSVHHRGDAFMGIGTLYFGKYKNNPIPANLDKAMVNFNQFIKFEETMDGYVRGQPGSACPLCGKPFKNISKDPQFKELMEKLSKGR